MTYRQKPEEPYTVNSSDIYEIKRIEDTATLGGSDDGWRTADTKLLQDEINKIIDALNKNSIKSSKSNNDRFDKAISYFGWIAFGFGLQAVGLFVFLGLELKWW